MPELGTATPATGDANGATPSAGQQPDNNGTPNTTPATGDGNGGPGDDGLTDAGRTAIQRERENTANARREAKELRDRIKALEEKDLPAAEKNARELAETKATNERLMGELRRERLSNAVMLSAARLGYADPMDAFRMIDADTVEFDDNGAPKDIETKLRAILDAKPYLKSTAVRPSGSADGGNNGGQPSGAADMNQLIRQAAGRG